MISFSLNLLIPAIVIISCVILAIIKFFIALRKHFPISVNCWFCNLNSRVPYNQRESFNCPKCLQYNGFTDDGDYNREMSEHHHARLNTSNTRYCQKTDFKLPSINGLCDACNRNQEMKVIQLSNFRPRIESKYDEEIEEYKQKLEDSYQLCQQCQRHLNKTLTRIKTKFIGSKISQLKGLQDDGSSRSLRKDRQILSKIGMVVIFILSIVNLVKDINLNLGFIRSISNEPVLNVYYHIVALGLTVVDLFKNLIEVLELPNLVEMNTDAVATSALILNIFILFKETKVQTQIIISMLFWSLKMVLSEVPINPSYFLAVKGFVAGILVLVSLHMLIKSRKPKDFQRDSNSSFHKIHTDVLDDSETEEDISGTSSFNFDVRSAKSSFYAPSSSIFAPSMTQFNSCIRDRTILEPKTFPYIESLNASHNKKSFHNSTLSRQNGTSSRMNASRLGGIDHLSNRSSFSIRQEVPSPNRSQAHRDDLFSNHSFSIREEVAAVDRNQVQNDINKLNISGNMLGSTSTLMDFQQSSRNPFSIENSRCGSPTLSIASVFSGSQRAQVVSPPRLEPTCMSEANKSWVAGGYWSSPQKQYLNMSYIQHCQEMSRSSSQSSGLGTTESGKNSRENSICHDDIPSIFSEPVRRRNLFDQSPLARSLHGQSFTPSSRVNNLFLSSNTNSFKKYR